MELNIDVLELKDRYDDLSKKYVDLALKIAPLLEQFGRYRKELEFIMKEFSRCGYTPKTNEDLVKIVEEEIKKRSSQNGQ